MKLAASLILSLSLVACASGGVKNPQQAGYALRTEYAAALDAADQYGRLPFCNGPTDPTICANRDVVIKIKAAKDIAKPAVEAAEAAVRSPNFDKSTYDAVIVAAQQALLALGKIIPQVERKP